MTILVRSAVPSRRGGRRRGLAASISLLAVLVLAASLAGCGPKGGGKKGEAAPGAQASDAPVTGLGIGRADLERLLAAPGIALRLTKAAPSRWTARSDTSPFTIDAEGKEEELTRLTLTLGVTADADQNRAAARLAEAFLKALDPNWADSATWLQGAIIGALEKGQDFPTSTYKGGRQYRATATPDGKAVVILVEPL